MDWGRVVEIKKNGMGKGREGEGKKTRHLEIGVCTKHAAV